MDPGERIRIGTDFETYVAEDAEDAENAAKQRLLLQWEQNLDDNFTAKPAPGAGTGDKKEPPAYRAFLDKLEVSIDTIDFVYQDPDGTFGGHIDSITLENNVASPADHQDHTVKSATLSGLAIYIDAAGAEHPNCTSSLPASDIWSGSGGPGMQRRRTSYEVVPVGPNPPA